MMSLRTTSLRTMSHLRSARVVNARSAAPFSTTAAKKSPLPEVRTRPRNPAPEVEGVKNHSTRDQYYLRPLTDTAGSPTYDYQFLSKPATVEVLGYPFSGGQRRAGVDLGPEAVIQAGLLDQLYSLGWQVRYDGGATKKAVEKTLEQFEGDSDPNIGRMARPRAVSAVNEALSKDVTRVAKEGVLPLTLGGDHSLAVGSVTGTKSKYPNAAVIWVDAHADINTPLTTDSGNLHGCPVSFLMGLEGTDVAPFNEWLSPCLKPEDIVYIGLRDIDDGEKRILKEKGIKVFTMHEVDKYGIGAVMEKTLSYIGKDRPIHLSYDVDALDPTIVAATGTPVRGGLTFREGHYIAEAIAETGQLVALDVVEVNPQLADEASVKQTVAVGCSLARCALGETLL